MHLCKLTLCFHVLPAVDRGSCIRLQRPAATVSPGRLLGVPGQTHTAVHSETVADLFAHMLAPGGFCKFGIQQCQISNPCSCKCIRWLILIRIWGKKTFSALNHVFLLLRNDDGRVRITVSPSQRCVLLRWCMLGVGLSNILPQQASFSLTFQFPAFNSKNPAADHPTQRTWRAAWWETPWWAVAWNAPPPGRRAAGAAGWCWSCGSRPACAAGCADARRSNRGEIRSDDFGDSNGGK